MYVLKTIYISAAILLSLVNHKPYVEQTHLTKTNICHYFLEENTSVSPNALEQAIPTTAGETTVDLPTESWAHRNSYHSNNHAYRSDIRYSPYPTQASRNSFLTNPSSFPHRPTPVMFGQSFAHPMYGAYSVPPAYVPSCDVFTPETNIENNTGDMFNISVANKY